jgi:hypothetical protein
MNHALEPATSRPDLAVFLERLDHSTRGLASAEAKILTFFSLWHDIRIQLIDFERDKTAIIVV